MSINDIELQLGDIIQIFYPLNLNFHEQIFIIIIHKVIIVLFLLLVY